MTFPNPPEQEEWRSVLGWEELYEVSSFGNVRRIKKTHIAKREVPYLLKQGRSAGYPYVVLCGKGKPTNKTVHFLVCTAFHGIRPSDKHEAAHDDGSTTNNYYKNLSWKTAKENQADRKRHGTTRSNHKLTEQNVIHIKELDKLGFNRCDLAKAWNVRYETVWRIVTGRSWSHPPKSLGEVACSF